MDYAARVLNGNVYSAVTAATGVDHGSSVSTTAAFALYNPSGSGVNLVILQGRIGYVSGTIGAGSLTWNANLNSVAGPSAGTAITPVNALLNGKVGHGLAKTTVTITAPTIIRPFANLAPMLATTAMAPWMIFDNVDGLIVVSPGATLSVHATAGAAGSTPKITVGVVWDEVPV